MGNEPVDRSQSLGQTKVQFAALSIVLLCLVWLAEMRIIEPQLATWSSDLIQPFFALPQAWFGPLLAGVSMLMGLAYFKVLLCSKTMIGHVLVLVRFVGQLALGVLWCYLVFVLKNLPAGVMIGLQFAAVALETGRIFSTFDRQAGLLMIPQIGWALYGFLYSAALLVENMLMTP